MYLQAMTFSLRRCYTVLFALYRTILHFQNVKNVSEYFQGSLCSHCYRTREISSFEVTIRQLLLVRPQLSICICVQCYQILPLVTLKRKCKGAVRPLHYQLQFICASSLSYCILFKKKTVVDVVQSNMIVMEFQLSTVLFSRRCIQDFAQSTHIGVISFF